MTNKELEKIKSHLQTQLQQLRASFSLKDRRPAEEAVLADINDQATLESERNFELNIKNRERNLILKVEDALQRISDGRYGVCEGCDEPINVKRLFARPTTSYCVFCKAEMEAEQRVDGSKELSFQPELIF